MPHDQRVYAATTGDGDSDQHPIRSNCPLHRVYPTFIRHALGEAPISFAEIHAQIKHRTETFETASDTVRWGHTVEDHALDALDGDR